MAPDTVTDFHTMTSPNTNAITILLADVMRAESKPTVDRFKTVYVGKDKFLLSILVMAPIGGEAWKKERDF